MLKRVAMMVVAALAGAAAASAQTSTRVAAAIGAAARSRRHRRRRHRRRARHRRGRDASGDDDHQRRYGVVVRADGRGVAGEEVVAERVPGELRSRPGLHRRVGLAGDVRRRRWATAPRSSARGRWCGGSTATCGRCSSRRSRWRAGVVNEHPFVRQGWSDNQLGDLWLGAKINLTSQWRQQPAAFARARDDQAADGEGRPTRASARARWISRFDAIVSKEVNQRVEVSGYGGVHLARRSGRRRSVQRPALGRRRSACRRARACASPRNCTASAISSDSVITASADAAAGRRGRRLPPLTAI